MRRKKLKIRHYKEKDVKLITFLGKKLHKDFKFDLDVFSNCLVAEENEELIGFVTYSVMYDRAEIIDIIVDPLYRGKSYGKKLLQSAIEIINDFNCLNITLEVSKENIVAIGLYEALGFKIRAIRKNYYNNIDGYLMEKDLR